MGRLVVLLVLVGCRLQPGASVVAEHVSPPAAAPEETTRTSTPAPAPPVPTGDRDGDGVPDARDGCPDEPEDHDQFEDEDGCVDRDNDRDRVPDAHEFKDGRWTNCDRTIMNGVEIDCRNRPEDYDGDQDHDGCPEVMCIDSCTLKIAGRVRADRRGKPDADAPKVLDEVAAALAAATGTRIWVEAHVDERRDDEAAKRLTQRLAEQVVEELVSRGVARERMEPIGWGDGKPIDRNTTEAGRANNRRVEFVWKTDSCCRPVVYEPPAEPPAPDCR